jgi:pyruvate dehydrogenase E1 component alpha subunit
MIECVTYRMQVHTTADDPKRYRKEEEVEEWRKRDPITRFQKYLKGKDLLDDGKIEELEEEIEENIKKAVETAEQKMKEFTNPLHMFEHVYAQLPPYTAQQREELKGELGQSREE